MEKDLYPCPEKGEEGILIVGPLLVPSSMEKDLYPCPEKGEEGILIVGPLLVPSSMEKDLYPCPEKGEEGILIVGPLLVPSSMEKDLYPCPEKGCLALGELAVQTVGGSLGELPSATMVACNLPTMSLIDTGKTVYRRNIAACSLRWGRMLAWFLNCW
jgi:hypothetical protein